MIYTRDKFDLTLNCEKLSPVTLCFSSIIIMPMLCSNLGPNLIKNYRAIFEKNGSKQCIMAFNDLK